MNNPVVIVVGGGGREHALTHALVRSARKPEVIVAPGNGGTAAIARSAPVSPGDIDGLVCLAQESRADLMVVGPEAPLVAGLADAMRGEGIPVVGPSAAAARLEGSKAFAKEVMDAGGVPTARWGVFEDSAAATAFARELSGKVAVKADGLAGGKGVIVVDDLEAAEEAVTHLLAAGGQVVIEEKLTGPELSVIALTDGEAVALMAPSQDHKRVGEADVGPNTGGMGAYAPAPVADDALLSRVEAECIRPVLSVLAARDAPFSGVLYAGLMLTERGPKVLEYNVRFGDPEAQVILPLLGEDPYEVLHSVATGTLRAKAGRLATRPEAALTVVLAAEGYPAAPRIGDRIDGLEAAAAEGAIVFHAGTRAEGADLVTAGGRVLAVTGIGPDLRAAQAQAYRAADRIRWPGMHYRRDIGWRALS